VFVNGCKCNNSKCNFVHKWLPKEDCFVKDDKVHNKDIFEGQKNYAYKIVNDNWDTIKDLMLNIEDGVLPAPKKVYKKVQEYFKKKNQDMTLPPKLNQPSLDSIGAYYGSGRSIGSKGNPRSPARSAPKIDQDSTEPSDEGGWGPKTVGTKFAPSGFDRYSQNASQRVSIPTANSGKLIEIGPILPTEISSEKRIFEGQPRQFESVSKKTHGSFQKVQGSYKVVGSESGKDEASPKNNNDGKYSKFKADGFTHTQSGSKGKDEGGTAKILVKAHSVTFGIKPVMELRGGSRATASPYNLDE
jgi:hypothetical protein